MAHVVASVFTVAPVVASLFRRVAARRLMLCAVGHRTNDRLSVCQSVRHPTVLACTLAYVHPAAVRDTRQHVGSS